MIPASPVGAALVAALPFRRYLVSRIVSAQGDHKGRPYRRPARNLHFPSPPAERGEMPQAEGGCGPDSPAWLYLAKRGAPPSVTP